MIKKTCIALLFLVLSFSYINICYSEEPLNETKAVLALPEDQLTFNQGLEEYKNSNYEKALSFFAESKKINPDNINTYLYEALSYRKSFQPIKGINLLNEAIEKFPDEAIFYHTLGTSFLLNNQRMKALDAFNTYQKMKPSTPEAYFSLGNTYSLLGNNTKSNYNYLKALSLYPKNSPDKKAECYVNVGVNYYNVKEYEEAKNYFNKAINLSPAFAKAIYYKGLSLYQLDNNDKKRFKRLFKKAKNLGFEIPKAFKSL